MADAATTRPTGEPPRRQPRGLQPNTQQGYAALPTTWCCDDSFESGQYTSFAFNQVLDDHGVLASIGTVGDALDNAMAESFVDSFKTELLADRVWRTRSQLELAIVEWVAWFNNTRLHEALGDRPPAELEALYATRYVLTPSLNQ